MSSGPTIAHLPATPTTASPAPARQYFVVLGSPIGKPQIIAGLLLLAFSAQCFWLALHSPLRAAELARIQQGQELLRRGASSADAARSPVIPVLAAAPLIGSGMTVTPENPGFYPHPHSWRWRARLPFMAIGIFLGASLWYVARRLYGNAGGYIALSLYAFSPLIITRATTIQPAIVAAWGAFGTVFTAIAVAHTLYAPREVVLWNWKRIGLLGLAITLAVGSQFALAGVVVLAFAFMLYLVPERRGAALAIIAAACAVAFLMLLAAYSFNLQAMIAAARGLRAADFAPQLLARKLTYTLIALFFVPMPGVLVALGAAVIAYVAWKRPRFFGVTAPLTAFALIMLAGIIMPQLGGYNLLVAALPFAYVFIAGVFSDLLETRYSSLVFGLLTGIILAHALVSVFGLLRI